MYLYVVYLLTLIETFKSQLIIEIHYIFGNCVDTLSNRPKMRRDTDGLLACASSGPRRAVLAQAQPRNRNGYGFSGITTFACRPTLLLTLCILSTDVARIAGAPPREEPSARFRSDERFLAIVLPATRMDCSRTSPLIGHTNFIHSNHFRSISYIERLTNLNLHFY